jgi:hypothetical protein
LWTERAGGRERVTERRECPGAIFVGLDVHRALITFVALDTELGRWGAGRIRSANRGTVRAFLAALAAKQTTVAVEAMTGWRLIAEDCVRVGIDVRLAEPAETRCVMIASGARRPTARRPAAL